MLSSGKIASLAGTTVRALRHYHQLGLLAEPERNRNGYREYGVTDLVRVLRIRTLAELGVPLDRMPELLDKRSPDSRAALDELDTELATTIERLTRQRAALAVIREEGLAPDMRPELARLSTLVAAMTTPSLRAVDEDLAVLFLHLAGDGVLPVIEAMYTHMTDADAVRGFAERFEELETMDVDAPAVVTLADDYVRLFAPLIERLRAHVDDAGDLPVGADTILETYTSEHLSPAQLETMRLVQAAFAPEQDRRTQT